MKILVFDDVEKNLTEVCDEIKRQSSANSTILPFISPETSNGGTFENRLKAYFEEQNDYPTLIVVDRDLSGQKDFIGLSEQTVRSVAIRLGIPECGYARGERADDEEYIAEGEHREACIRLPLMPISTFASNVLAIARGFQLIDQKIKTLIEQKTVKPIAAHMLAEILERPDDADKISLYASGDQSRLSVLMNLSSQPERRSWQLACFLGYWLWDSVLRFPGVVVNAVSGSSYLNIHKNAFQNDQAIRDLFATAKYTGPFAEAKEPLWWRRILDEIIDESGCNDGREFAMSKLNKEIRRSECCEDSTKEAGYYCFFRKMPVSLANSKPGFGWFPRGADLARISKSKYDEESPWM